jgi:hypothetical protein
MKKGFFRREKERGSRAGQAFQDDLTGSDEFANIVLVEVYLF